jgi:hypothetical protein
MKTTEIDTVHLAKCLTSSGTLNMAYVGEHINETPGWAAVAAEVLRLTEANAALDAQLKTVLDRESATHARHDAKLDALEAQIAAADRLAKAMDGIANSKNLEAPCEYSRGWNASRFRLREIAIAALAAYRAGGAA